MSTDIDLSLTTPDTKRPVRPLQGLRATVQIPAIIAVTEKLVY